MQIIGSTPVRLKCRELSRGENHAHNKGTESRKSSLASLWDTLEMPAMPSWAFQGMSDACSSPGAAGHSLSSPFYPYGGLHTKWLVKAKDTYTHDSIDLQAKCWQDHITITTHTHRNCLIPAEDLFWILRLPRVSSEARGVCLVEPTFLGQKTCPMQI